VLTNAIWFKGEWATHFSKELTQEQDFHVSAGVRASVPMMCLHDHSGYVHGDGFQAVDLPYRDSDLSMLVVVPDKRDGLARVESRLSDEVVADAVRSLRRSDLTLYVPRFTFKGEPVRMNEVLAGMGMPVAFERGLADFSGIDGRRPPDEESLYISSVIHQAFVEVNERGTEAAAATAMIVPGAAPFSRWQRPIPVVRADHPFAFVIRDRPSGAILFIGRVTDPRASI